ncbi:MAG: carboxypeptidase regulatory-like domain-containing protein [Thermoanaerobaculia bacterium]
MLLLLPALAMTQELLRAESFGVCQIPGGGAAISGRVTAEATGAGIAGVKIIAEALIDGFLTFVESTTTTENGDYQLAALFGGQYFVRTAQDALFVDEVWPNGACEEFCEPDSAGTAIPVSAGSALTDVDLALTKGGRIEGFVYLADGTTPASGASVHLFRLGPSGTADFPAVLTDANGAWAYSGLAAASYKVRATAPGLLAEVYPNAPCPDPCNVFPTGDPIAVAVAATTSGIDLALPAGATVSGLVIGPGAAPLADVLVEVRNSSGSIVVYGRSSASGAWVTGEGLPPGTYFARTSSSFVDELWQELPCEPGCTASAGTPIVLGSGNFTGIDFTLARLGAISGTIVESGTLLPLADVAVSARDSKGAFAGFGNSAADGTFRIDGLAAGEYLLAALDGAHAGEIYDDAGSCYDLLNCFPSGEATLVAVAGTAETTGIHFVLDRGGELAGVVVAAATKLPVSGASVTLFTLAGDAEVTAFTDAGGRFDITGVPAGVSYRVRALPPPGVDLLGEVWEEQPCTPSVCPVDGGAAVPLTLGSTACVAFTLAGALEGSGIAGEVAGGGEALAGVPVTIFDAGGISQGTVLTDAAGAYRTNGALALAAGTYFLVASGPPGFATELYDGIVCDACNPVTGTPVTVVDGATTSSVSFDLNVVGTPPLPRTTLFLENCKPNGCVYFPSGFDDSRVNRSSILTSVRHVPEFGFSAEFWGRVVSCVQRAFEPFGIAVVDVDPGSAPHLEHVIAGSPGDIGQPEEVAGVSPFSCEFIPNSISFTFSEAFGSAPIDETLAGICWTAVHEIGHQHGLDHHFYVPDAMTYLDGCGAKVFPDRDVPCGEFSERPCVCPRTSENSYRQIRAAEGPSAVLFHNGFEVVEPGQNCAWSHELPPPVPFAESAGPLPVRSCGALLPSNAGLRLPAKPGSAKP